jgi:triacylglycerol lipase
MKLFILLVATALCASLAQAADIIVLVHGLAGWGEGELLGLNYFGMFFGNPENSYKVGLFGNNEKSVKYILKGNNKGWPVKVASVGPFSTNWERACELYAQIRGLRTDYGANFSSRAGTDRYTQVGSKMDFSTKTAWLSNWGTSGNTDRIVCIGHSQGAPTCRALERLMQIGNADEAKYADRSELFRTDLNRGSAFRAVVTVSGVNDGSTFQAKAGTNGVNLIKDIVLGVDTVATVAGTIFGWDDGTGSVYDFDLSHRPLLRQNAGESFNSWLTRVFAAPEWASTYKYFAHYDLSYYAQRKFNLAGNRGYSNTKYLAISTSRTSACWYWIWDQCAGGGMEAIMAPTGTLSGNLDSTCDPYDPTICFSDSDEENDGLVSRIATQGPHHGTLISGTQGPQAMILKTVCDVYYAWPFQNSCFISHQENDWANMVKGQWYYLNFNYDHLQAVGWQSTGWTGSIETPITDIWANNILPFINSL